MPYVFLIILTKEEEKNKMLRQRNFRFNSCTESMKMTLTFYKWYRMTKWK